MRLRLDGCLFQQQLSQQREGDVMGKSLFYLVFVLAGVLAAGLPTHSSAESYGMSQQAALYAGGQGTTYAAKDEGQREMYDLNGSVVGTLKRTEQGNFKFYDKGGRFRGLILRSGIWMPDPSERQIRITPEAARLYLDALRAIETMK
jgi:hypothetical protein